MPRRYHSGTRHYNTAPPAIKIVQPKLDRDGLAVAYDWALADPVLGLRLALEWFADTGIPAMTFGPGKGLNDEQLKNLNRADKGRNLGEGTTCGPEKIAAWRMAIKMYERTWPNEKLLSVEDALHKGSAKISPSREVRAAITVIDNLNSAFQSSGMKFRPTFQVERDYAPGFVSVPLQELNTLVGTPPLKAALNEALGIANFLSLRPVPVEGKYVMRLDGGLYMQTLPKVLDGVYLWAEKQDGRTLIAPIRAPRDHAAAPAPQAVPTAAAPAPAQAAPAAPRAKRAAGIPGLHATVDAMLRRSIGATMSQIIAATNWAPKTVSNYMCYTLKRRGITVKSFKVGAEKAFRI